MYLGVPMMAFIVTLFLRKDNWWELSLLTWFASVLIFWCFFSACVMIFDLYLFMRMMEDDEEGRDSLRGASSHGDLSWREKINYYVKLAWRGSVRTMRFRLSGKHKYFKRMNVGSTRRAIVAPSIIEDRIKCCKNFFAEGLYSYFANKGWNKCFVQMQQERRIHTLEETLCKTVYVTEKSWGLEKLFCRSGG